MTRSLPWLCAAAMALALCMPGRSAAQAPNPYLAAGIRLYSELEPERALEQLKKARKYGHNTPQDDVRISMYIGLVKFELGDGAGAEADFKEALALDPEVALPKGVSPKVAVAFEKARKDILKTRPPKVKTGIGQPTQTTGTGEPRLVTTTGTRPGDPKGPQVTVVTANPDAFSSGTGASTTAEVHKPRSKALSFVLMGAGVAAGGLGALFGVQSSSAATDAKNAQFQSDAASLQDDAKSKALAANLCYGGAALAVVAGVVTLLIQ